MKAEEYITQWCDETYKGGKELGDWTTTEVMKFANDFANEKLRLLAVSGSLPLTFEQCLREEFLVNTQNYPKEYHNLFNQKFNRARKRFEEQ